MAWTRARTLARCAFLLGAGASAAGCAAILGLENGTDAPPVELPDGSTGVYAPSKDGTSRAESGSDTSIPPGQVAIQGIALDAHGLPLVGATIRVRPTGQTADASNDTDATVGVDGRFSTRSVAPYDLYLGVGKPDGEPPNT